MASQSGEDGKNNGEETRAIPLETIGPRQIETRSRTYSGSILCQDIQRKIDNGSHECGVCWEPVTCQSKIWHCYRCRGVFHLECMINVACGTRGSAEEVQVVELQQNWKCPSCRDMYWGPPMELCWCGKRFGTLQQADLPFNSCGEKCAAKLSCRHDCEETCHPGHCDTCHMCARGVPVPVLPTTRPAPEGHQRPIRMPRDSLTLDRQRVLWRIHPRDEELAVETATAAHPKRTFKLLAGCLVMSGLMATATYFLTQMHVKPYNYSSVVENKHAMPILWASVIIMAFINSVVNGISVPKLRSIVSQCWHSSRFAEPWRRRLFECEVCILVVVGYLVYLSILVAWAVGPLVSAVAAPLMARTAEFSGVCDGFDTRIILDIGDQVRQNPIFHDLDPSSSHPAYTMAIVDRSANLSVSTSLELNYYDGSYQRTFGVPPALTPTRPVARVTTYTHRSSRFTHSRTHTPLQEEPNPREVWRALAARNPALPPSMDDVRVEESPGFYRVRYDWSAQRWSTEVAGQAGASGDFARLGSHLVLPSLGLQVPLFERFASSCRMEPYLKMHRAAPYSARNDNDDNDDDDDDDDAASLAARLHALALQNYKDDPGADVVLRAAAFGPLQAGLEICARRRDETGREGLGSDLPVVVGLLAAARFRRWEEGGRRGC